MVLGPHQFSKVRLSRHDELRVKKQVGKGIIRKVGGKRKQREALTVCPGGPVGFYSFYLPTRAVSNVVRSLVANNMFVEIKFSLRESQHVCHSTTVRRPTYLIKSDFV